MSETPLPVGKRAGRCVSDNPIRLDWRRWTEKRAAAEGLLCYRKPMHIESLKRQERIIATLVQFQEKKEPLSPVCLMAALALRDGWDADEMLKDINAISALERSCVIAPKWTSRCFYRPVKDGLYERIVDFLISSRRPLNSLELLDYLAGKFNGAAKKRSLNDVNLICNLLEAASRITKLPNDSALWNNNYGWIHNNYRFTSATIPTWNIKYVLLQVLSQHKAMTKAELTANTGVRKLLSSSRTAINPDLIATSLKSPLDFLLHQSLIRALPPINRTGRKAARYAITDEARMYLESSEKYLDEGFRLALLGCKTKEMSASEESTLESIIRCINVLREAEKKRAGHSAEGENNGNNGRFRLVQQIVKSLEENESYVRSVIYANSRPWHGMSAKNLGQWLLPRLSELSKPHADWLKRELDI